MVRAWGKTSGVLLMLFWVSCTFDPALLSQHQCTILSDCDGLEGDFICSHGFCQPDDDNPDDDNPDDDPDDVLAPCLASPNPMLCSNGIFCDGVELCSPDTPGADPLGCIRGEAPLLDDGVACTIDRCDEDLDAIIHEETSCACLRDEDCQQLCMTGTCEAQGCVFVPATPGTACDDGVACTSGESCDEAQRCIPLTLNGSRCDDGLVCNGEEFCDPESEGADAQGCLSGVPLLERVYEDIPTCVSLICAEPGGLVRDDSACCDLTQEGLPGSETCRDGLDSDCDGLIDAEDPDCILSPGQWEGLVLWLDASDLSTFDANLTDGDKVALWRDKSGGERDARQGEDWRRPLYKAEAVQGLPGVVLDGSNDRLVIDDEHAFDFTDQMTMAIVFSIEDLDVWWQALIAKGDEAWRLHRNDNTSQLAFGITTGPFEYRNLPTRELGENQLYLVLMDVQSNGNGITRRIFLNQMLESQINEEKLIGQNDKAVWIGANQSWIGRQWEGSVSEILVFNRALGENERQRLTAGLIEKWNITPLDP